MAKRVVVWTKTAARQRRKILQYWTDRNGSTAYAEKLIETIDERIQYILKYPKLYKATDYPDTRESAMGHYSLFYKSGKDELVVMAFWDNRDDPKKLFAALENEN